MDIKRWVRDTSVCPGGKGYRKGWCVLLGRKQSSLTPCLLGGWPMKSSKQAGGQSLAGGTDWKGKGSLEPRGCTGTSASSLRPPSPSHLSLPLGGWKAWQDWDHAGLIWTFSQQLPPQKPRLSLRARGLHGGQSMAGPESQLGFRRGVLGEGVKDELKG